MGGGGSLVIFARRAVDFRRVIIHVLNVGHSHFSNNCHAISVLYLVAVQAIYNFALRLQGICSCVHFRDTFSTCKLGAEKYGEWVGPATNYSKLWSRTLWTCASSAHSKIVFHQPSRCSLAYKFNFQVDSKVVEVDKFFRGCYQALPPYPCGESLGTRVQ